MTLSAGLLQCSKICRGQVALSSKTASVVAGKVLTLLINYWPRRSEVGLYRYLNMTSLKFCDSSKESSPKIDSASPKVNKAKENISNEWQGDYRTKYQNPISRAFGVIGDDIQGYFGDKKRSLKRVLGHYSETDKVGNGSKGETAHAGGQKFLWPSTCDVLVIGGGAVGSSVAYHLKERAINGLSVVVVEQDASYRKASTVLSVGGIRQQFSLPENIQLSLYGMQFLRNAPKLLAVEGEELPNVQFNPGGYLTLASEEGVENLKENFYIQREVGAKVEFLTAKKLQTRFSWINTDGVEAGVIGLENEGWFDPWSLLFCLRRKAVSLGAEYITGKVTGLTSRVLDDVVTEGIGNLSIRNINTAEVMLPDGERRHIKFSILVVAAGAWSGEIGQLLGIGSGRGIMGIPIPIEPRKRYVYCVHAPDGPGLDCPLVIDPNNTYFRREGLGGLYLCGRSPSNEEEPDVNNLNVDEKYFEDKVWPTIAKRVTAFEKLKLKSSWAGYYDYNTFDQNGIIGLHPNYSNLFIAAGFSGHGIQQAPGIGRAIMECILHGEFATINLERFGFERVLMEDPLLERGIV